MSNKPFNVPLNRLLKIVRCNMKTLCIFALNSGRAFPAACAGALVIMLLENEHFI